MHRMATRNDAQHARNLELLHRWRGGDRQAIETLLSLNSPLVWFWVRRSRWSGERNEELHAAGMLGLLRGLERYEEGHGSSVATYCTWWIRQAIDREAQRWARHAREVPLEEIGDGRDAGTGGDDTAEAAVEAVEDENARGELQEKLQRLAGRERDVLEAWIMHDGNLARAAAALEVAESGARNILYRAWSKIQHPAAGGVVAELWPERACRDAGIEEFFPSAGRPNAKLRCGSCPVAEQCLAYALARPQLCGVWGGTSEHARRVMRRDAR